MNRKTRKVTVSALCAALTVITLYLYTLAPTGQLGIVAMASLFVAAANIEAGLLASVLVYAGSSVIGALILPNKSMLLLYIVFFGYYPIVKSLVERMKTRVLEWIIKLAVFFASLSLIWLLLRGVIFGDSPPKVNTALLYAGGCAVFVLFDIGLTKLIGFYTARISVNIRRGKR